MDRDTVVSLLADMAKLEGLLRETLVDSEQQDEPLAVVTTKPGHSQKRLLKKVAALCDSSQKKLMGCQAAARESCQRMRKKPRASVSKDSSNSDESSPDTMPEAETNGQQSSDDEDVADGIVKTIKVRPMKELLCPQSGAMITLKAEDRSDNSDHSDSGQANTELANIKHANGVMHEAAESSSEQASDDEGKVESRNIVKTIKVRPLNELLGSRSEPKSTSTKDTNGHRQSTKLKPSTKPQKRVKCTKLSVALKRLPNDLAPLLRAEGLNECVEVAQYTEKHLKSATTMPRKRAAPQKVRVVTGVNSDDEEADMIVPIPTTSKSTASVAAAAAAPKSSGRKKASPIVTDDNDSDEDINRGATPTEEDEDEPINSDDEEARAEPNESDSNAAEAKDSDDDDDDFATKRKRKPRKKKTSSQSDESEDVAKPKKKRRRIKKTSDNDSDDGAAKRNGDADADDGSDDADGSKSKAAGRKNIRKVIKTRDLESDTKRAAREEAERKKRIEERQKLYNSYYDDDVEGGEGAAGKPEAVKVLDKLILDFDEKTKEELISVDRQLVRRLKPHQGNGVKFMWDTCFESLERIEVGPGSGCILAHCMGLGKSLQVVTLVHTLLAHTEKTRVEKVLVICPLSTVLNWVNEFKIWLKQCAANRDIEIYEISKFKQNYERVYQINEWHQEGGVLIMGYDMFRNLSSETSRLKKREKETVQRALIDPGPDLVVCDEGHLLKNSKTSLSKAVNRVRTLRRVVLTGTPLQNNLNEYYCMVQFVKPNLLGKYNEYLNRFVNPITNGQYVDSTPFDIQMMKRRSHILHKLLDGCVQRRDYAVLAPYLPVKHEYVVYVQLTELQRALYRYYMEHKPSGNTSEKPTRSSVLFQDFQNLQRIWTHPRVLRYNSDRFEIAAQKKRDAMSDDESEGSIKDFLDDTSDEESSAKSTPPESDEEDVMSIHSDDSDPKRNRKKSGGKVGRPSTSASSRPSTSRAASGRSAVGTRRTRAQAEKDSEPEEFVQPAKVENPTEWWMSMCPEEELDVLSHSGKLMLIFSLLEECEQIGDKLLVFSQSLYSLDVIENFLAKIDDCTQRCNKARKPPASDDDEDEEQTESLDPEAEAERKRLGGFSGSWSLGLDYFRLDGSTNIENRNLACKAFNREDNPRARLFLISTRAGGLGINLVAANRVVIFDVSWNPSHDIQSIFRVYRFGQKKPCYIYRFIAMGTMEEKVYERQVTKLAISKRVIDEHQIDRHYKENDLMELYKTELEPTEPRPTPILPKDRLFAGQLKRFSDIIFKYHEHESLLENKQEETLNEEEIKAAWEEFEAEKVARPQINYAPQQRAPGMGPLTSNHIFGIRSDIMLQLLRISARKTYPMADENQIKQLVPLMLQQLYEKMQTGDTSMLQQLMVLQSELEAPPNFAFNQMVNQMVPQEQLQHQQMQHHQQLQMQHQQPYNMMVNRAPPITQMTQQQLLINQAQNRLLKTEARQQLANRPPPTQTGAVIELD